MKINSIELESIAMEEKSYPKNDLIEIAFAGRSNVGKSSFINAMLGRRKLAYVSSKPGKTRTINFYKINDSFRFVDLPGYGYAQVSKKEKEKWAQAIETYLLNRDNLKEIVLIVDIRHKPSKDDIIMYNFIKTLRERAVIIATKSDKISRGARNKHLNIIRKDLSLDDKDILLDFSSEKKDKLNETWRVFKELLEIE